ncbi:unnamed protein product [Discosporangium mesarthrocarpum]
MPSVCMFKIHVLGEILGKMSKGQAVMLSSIGVLLGIILFLTTGKQGWPPSALVGNDDHSSAVVESMITARGTVRPVSANLKDIATGITFPRQKRFASKVELFCLGVGVRVKKIAVVNVKVYSVGLYVEAKAARGALKTFKGISPETLSGDASLYKALGNPGFTKYLHLIFARGVEAQKVVDALTSVKGVSEEALSSFSSLILEAISGKIGEGESISLGWEGKDKMLVLVQDKLVGVVKDPALPKAVFELYLGAYPVSESAKAAFAEGVSELLGT